MKAIIIGAVIFVVALIVGVVVILIFVDQGQPFLQKTANLSVTLISVLACGLLIAITALVAVLAALVTVLSNLTKTKVSPLIDKINETADTARGTAVYVGESVASPMIRTAALIAGVRGAVSGLFRKRS
jgi:uncharacterized membrane protein YccC